MATGINIDKVNQLKIDLLDYTEAINALLIRLDNCKTSIQMNMDGMGKEAIINKLNLIIERMPKVNANINSYIVNIDKVVTSFENQDQDLASEVTNHINKLGI